MGNFEAIIATSFLMRLRGLLFRTPLQENQCLVLSPCRSIHTFGMTYAIDVFYLDLFGCVIDYRLNIPPNRLYVSRQGGVTAIEFKSGFLSRDQDYRGINFRYK